PAVDEFNLAVLKALGMSKSGFILITFLEQLLVLVFGVVAGVACGFFMARIAVDAASQTEMKVNALPPIVFSTDWVYLGGFVFALVLLSTVIFIWDVFFLKRISVVETIRISGQSG
ncbi:MAG: FtsX-like permease family protein, partial [SAR202 cluster bacterium]|nr:FtsX-like permease family protein [SAR202 cluster bacterium]